MPRHIQTTLLDPTPRAPVGFRSLATATHRGSTTLFASAREVRDDWCPERVPYAYGLHGTPTSLELAARVAQLEGAEHCFITPGGQAAIALVYFAFCGAGDHVLVPQSAYGPNNDLARDLLARLGIAVQTYDPMIGAEIATLIRPNTTLIWCESPGSATMEIQDVPAIAEVARAAGVVLALDNTYASGVFFDAYAHGVDVSIQALTKYIGGHSDLLLGSVSTCSDVHYQALGQARSLLGMAVSPDDCSLALRGLQTLWVRLAQLQASTLQVAHWLKARPEVERVLHPALPDCPGHGVWLRDFTGSTSVFSVVFRPTLSGEALLDFIDRLNLFHLGYSWGGVTSLVAPHFNLDRDVRQYGDRLVRFNIGLEHVDDLIADLEHAFFQADNHGDGQ
ncbi:cystathionine beta-lyase [Pseudomonas sp. BIGb0164]|uniref:cystathionine beta-lyase n=1 Tax=Pseudomonas sp. BIGb0164 TaxID=2940605 RepID=UPI002169CB30|nr:cystathionine beta-lyase [Pseudomonas sp. BIGb0164]MCS4251590.1 cystathionine beta-lyase [Pseudomonas sp. BIGb0164]